MKYFLFPPNDPYGEPEIIEVDVNALAREQLGADIWCRWRGYHDPYKPPKGDWPFHLISAKHWPHYCLQCGVLIGEEPELPTIYHVAMDLARMGVPVHPNMKRRLDEVLDQGRKWFRYGR